MDAQTIVFEDYWEVNLQETARDEQKLAENSVCLCAKAKEIVTLCMK